MLCLNVQLLDKARNELFRRLPGCEQHGVEDRVAGTGIGRIREGDQPLPAVVEKVGPAFRRVFLRNEFVVVDKNDGKLGKRRPQVFGRAEFFGDVLFFIGRERYEQAFVRGVGFYSAAEHDVAAVIAAFSILPNLGEHFNRAAGMHFHPDTGPVLEFADDRQVYFFLVRSIDDQLAVRGDAVSGGKLVYFLPASGIVAGAEQDTA